jgi:ribosome-associated toxin RatA of RatAB toxin-antitoxin module
MKMYIDGLKIEGSETDFEVLRINYEMCSRAFHELTKLYNAEIFNNMEIEFHNKAQAIAEHFGGIENDK